MTARSSSAPRLVELAIGTLAAGLLCGACGTSTTDPAPGPSVTTGAGGSGGGGGITGGSGKGESGTGAETSGGAGDSSPPIEMDAAAEVSVISDASSAEPEAATGEGGGAAACASSNYAACLDFENGKDPKWAGLGTNVQMGQAAHGSYAFHGPPKSLLTLTQLGGITNLMWGRFYLHMTPGAPYGHGEIIGAYDQSNNWYELGFEFNGLQGNWHGNGGEKYMRSHPNVPDKWVCVEFEFDGATPAVAQIWMDGQAVDFYDVSNLAGPSKVTKFTKFEIGFNPYHGLSLKTYEGNTAPALTDVWIDDIALDTKRIGCIQ